MCKPAEIFTGPDAGAQADAAGKANRRQQAAIDYGMQQLDAIYGGGTYNQYAQAGGTYDPKQQYYTLKDGTYTPYQVPEIYAGKSGPNKHGSSISGTATGAEVGSVLGPIGVIAGSGIGSIVDTGNPDPISAALGLDFFGGGSRPASPWGRLNHGKLFTATPSQNFAGYNNDFFNQRARAYEDYALPQLGQQYQTTKNAVNFNLANRGLLGGSVAGKENNDLNLTMGQQKQAIADQGQQQAQSLRSDVQNSKLQAISQLYQTANPAQAQASALADASRFTAPSAFAPLANGFSNLVNQYTMNQQIAGYQQQPGGYGGGGGYSPYGQYTSPQAQALPQNY